MVLLLSKRKTTLVLALALFCIEIARSQDPVPKDNTCVEVSSVSSFYCPEWNDRFMANPSQLDIAVAHAENEASSYCPDVTIRVSTCRII